MGNNRSGYDPTNEPTKDDLIARKPTTEKEYNQWMELNDYAKSYEDQLRKEAIDEERKNRKSLIQIWSEGGTS